MRDWLLVSAGIMAAMMICFWAGWLQGAGHARTKIERARRY